MQSTLVVEVDVLSDDLAQLLVIVDDHSVDRVRLHRVIERLHVCVVVHPLVHALHDSQLGQPIPEDITGILGAAITMEDKPRPWTATMHRPVQRLQGQPLLRSMMYWLITWEVILKHHYVRTYSFQYPVPTKNYFPDLKLQ